MIKALKKWAVTPYFLCISANPEHFLLGENRKCILKIGYLETTPLSGQKV
jgi:hypothetical protein